MQGTRPHVERNAQRVTNTSVLDKSKESPFTRAEVDRELRKLERRWPQGARMWRVAKFLFLSHSQEDFSPFRRRRPDAAIGAPKARVGEALGHLSDRGEHVRRRAYSRVSLTRIGLNRVEPANEDVHEQETRATSGLTTTENATRGAERPRRLTWRVLLALISVTLLAALVTLFIGRLLLTRQGAP